MSLLDVLIERRHLGLLAERGAPVAPTCGFSRNHIFLASCILEEIFMLYDIRYNCLLTSSIFNIEIFVSKRRKLFYERRKYSARISEGTQGHLV